MTVFSVGQVVRLKSGGPLMTVFKEPKPADLTTEDVYQCLWFSKQDTPHTAGFDCRTIRSATPVEVMSLMAGED